MYGPQPGQPSYPAYPQQPGHQQAPYSPPPGHAYQQPPAYQQPYPQQPYAQQPQPSFQPQQQQPRSRAAAGPRPHALTLAAVGVLAITGFLGVLWGPVAYLTGGYDGVRLTDADPRVLVFFQVAVGIALVAGAVFVLLRSRPGWAVALSAAAAFGVLEGFFVTRGVPQAFAGVFLVVLAVALLTQDPVRRHCGVGPPSR